MKLLTNVKVQLAIGIALMSHIALAHDGHDHSVPGAIPSGYHGGKISEAESKGGTPTSTDELFFEVVYKGKHASIYPLLLERANLKEFKKMSPKDLGKVEIVGENGRTKKTEPLKAASSESALEVDFELKGTNFGFVTISAEHAGVRKQARAQIGKH